MSETDKAKLNIYQRLNEVRKAVPEITKKKHSENVKYKFAKIFDVYELMTPACNLWGVDFDIIAEAATRQHENGDAMYYTNYTQQTKNGARLLWVYEADITVRWTNIDNPADFIEVQLHAVGTNDSGPDKAKGSAWTYALKYYLFERFQIDQGEDDPDNYDNTGNWNRPPAKAQQQRAAQPKQQTQQAKPPAQQQARQTKSQPKQQPAKAPDQAQTQPPTKTPDQAQAQPPQAQNQGGEEFNFVSMEDVSDLYALAAKIGLSKDRMDKRIREKYNISGPEFLTYDQYDDIALAISDSVAAKERADKEEQQNA